MKKIRLTSLKSRFFNAALVLTAFAIAMTLAGLLCTQIVSHQKQIASDRFQARLDTYVSLASAGYDGAASTLRAMQGYFAGSQFVARDEFYDFVDASEFFKSYQGFSTLAYIRRVPQADLPEFLAEVRSDQSVRPDGYPSFAVTPEGQRDEYWPIVYISPEDQAGFLLGQDQLTEPVRAENLTRARDLGQLSLSAAVRLGQGGVGALIAAPLYEGGRVPDSLAERRRLFSGAVTSAFVLDDFFGSTLPTEVITGLGIGLAVSGRTGNTIPVVAVPADDRSFFARLYGTMEKTMTINLGAQQVDFVASVPAYRLLSKVEAYEPISLALIMLIAAVFMSIVVLVSQRAKDFADVKARYAFIATLSHQLRTPLTRLRWSIESHDPSEQEGRAVLLESVSTLNSIIQRMLLYIELGKKKTSQKRRSVSLESLYDWALRFVAENHEVIRLTRKGARNVAWRVLVDPDQVALALSYVMENALTYSQDSTKVSVEMETVGQMAEIRVSDSGFGIPEAEQDRLFGIPFRASNASLGKNVGSGVSLIIARQIVEANGGQIGFTSREKQGSVFFLRLPLAEN